MKAAAQETGLTFHWPRRESFSFVLFGCVLASLAAHAATFFLFKVVDLQRATISPPTPQVSLLTPSTPENIALLHWIDAEDPALVASANTVPPLGVPVVAYRPSFASKRTQPLGAPKDKAEAVPFPPAKDFMSVMGSSASVPPAAVPPAGPSRTAIRFAGPLAERAPGRELPFPFPPHAPAPLEAAQWLIGVNAHGEVRYTFLQHPSGDPAFDAAAAAHLRRLTFLPAADPIAWSFTTIEWGDDAYSSRREPPSE